MRRELLPWKDFRSQLKLYESNAKVLDTFRSVPVKKGYKFLHGPGSAVEADAKFSSRLIVAEITTGDLGPFNAKTLKKLVKYFAKSPNTA